MLSLIGYTNYRKWKGATLISQNPLRRNHAEMFCHYAQRAYGVNVEIQY